MVEKAVAALGAAHPQEGDTVELAAAKTGLDASALTGIVSQLGGESALGDLAAVGVTFLVIVALNRTLRARGRFASCVSDSAGCSG